jgi:hypothetical protein
MLNGHGAMVLMSERQKRTLSFSERMRRRVHVTMCRSCANLERQPPALGAAARTFADHGACLDNGKSE